MTLRERLLPHLEGRADAPPGPLLGTALAALGGVGMLYGGIQAARAAAYRHGTLPTYRPPCPTIAVGNLTTGGTGKTPLTLWLARWLQQRGRRVAVVSRGYGQASRKAVTVVSDPQGVHLAPPEAADEAVLSARRLPGVAVVTGPQRRLTIPHAVAAWGVDAVVMDDAFQHLPVARDLNLCLVDCARPLGNGQLLPGGILREFPAALRRADAIVITRADDPRQLAVTRALLAHHAPGVPAMACTHHPRHWRRLDTGDTLPLERLRHTPALAFCGIAQPAAFAATLARVLDKAPPLHPLPDHQPFNRELLAGLTARARGLGAEVLLCTEKDGVKIDPDWSELPLYTLELELKFQQEPRWLLERLESLFPMG